MGVKFNLGGVVLLMGKLNNSRERWYPTSASGFFFGILKDFFLAEWCINFGNFNYLIKI